ncbi:MAG: hypothetical protein ABI337_07020 [Nitrososphaera sp.]
MVAASKDTASTKQYFRDTAVRHTFNDRTGAIFHYSHVPLTYWFSTFCMVSWCGISIRSTSLQLGIPYRIYHHMIKIIMERIASLDNPKLDGIRARPAVCKIRHEGQELSCWYHQREDAKEERAEESDCIVDSRRDRTSRYGDR